MRGELGKLSLNFSAKEFECACGCLVQTLDMDLVGRLEELRALVRKPISIHSGFRCLHHNLVVGGARASTHLIGHGCDISWGGWTGDEMERVAGAIFDSIGIGHKFIHVDIRSGRRRWRYA